MPEHSLYWYGNECIEITGGWSVSGWTGWKQVYSGQKNTNNMYVSATSSYIQILGTNNLIYFSPFTTLKNVVKSVGGNSFNTNGWQAKFNGGAPDFRLSRYDVASGVKIDSLDISSYNNAYINVCGDDSNGAGYLYALWLE